MVDFRECERRIKAAEKKKAEDDGVPPTRVLCAERISEVSVGTHHTVLRACSGTVYTYGRGAEGQLGHGAWEARRTPTAIPTCAFH